MRRILTAICVSVLLAGGALSGAHAASLITIVGSTLLDISVRDADRGDVLSTLFTIHDNAQKRVLVMQDSVTGHLDHLELVQASFDLAFVTILGNNYRYQLEISGGVATYRVSLKNPPAPAATRNSTPASTAKPPANTSHDTGLVMHFAPGSDSHTGTASGTPGGAAPNNANPNNNANWPNNANPPNGAGSSNNNNNATAPNGMSVYMNASLDSNGNTVRKPVYVMQTPDGGYVYGTPGTNGQAGSFWYIGPQSQGIAVPYNISTPSTPTPTPAGGTTKK